MRKFFERERQLLGARLYLFEQAHVLDGDDGLVGKGLHEIDLALAERSGLRPSKQQHAFDRAVAHQRHREHRPVGADGRRVAKIIFGVGLHVGDVDRLAVHEDPAGDRLATGLDRVGMHEIDKGLRAAGFGLQPHHLAVAQAYDSERCAAQRLRGLGQRGEHRFQVEGRAADDLEHIGGRGLLLQGFAEIVGALAQFVEQAGVLDGDHRLIGEAGDQIDLLVGKRREQSAEKSRSRRQGCPPSASAPAAASGRRRVRPVPRSAGNPSGKSGSCLTSDDVDELPGQQSTRPNGSSAAGR